jgi:hypothetical protein
MKKIFFMLLILCSNVWAVTFVDLKFGRYQIADSQWNVSACMYTATCQIYSKNPGTAYKIPWTSGQLTWAAGDYVAFVTTGNSTNPFNAIQYSSDGTQKAVMGTGHIINMGNDYFFFVGNDNNTGQLFSMTQGFANTSGVTWTGTLNPTVDQVNAYAANGSTAPLAAGQTAAPAAPSLCCGGSSAAIGYSSANATKLNAFLYRTTVDSRVFVEQIGNQNSITVNQTGTVNNYTKYYGNGSNNEIVITQIGNTSTTANYVDASVNGNSNRVNVQQQSTGGTKGAFITVQDSTNSVIIQQKDSGSHYAEVSLTGGNKNVDVLQQGNAGHMASINLTGLPVDLSLTQSGTAGQNFYSINFNCATAGGCPKITVNQTK